MNTFERILFLSDECVRLCLELQGCFQNERIALIEFKMDDLIQNNFNKERLLGALTATKQKLRDAMAEKTGGIYDCEQFEKTLSASEFPLWVARRNEWLSTWELLRNLCEKNQNFFKHSLRNLDAIVDNLKRLFGLHSTYTSKGMRQETSPRGSVVEGSY